MPEEEYLTGPPLPRRKGFTGFIYVITNKVNGKQYVGQTTTTLGRRWNGHRWQAKRNAPTPLHRAINKYGIENFTFEELSRVDSPDLLGFLNALETHHIKTLSTLVPYGYNLESGGGNRKKHPDTCAKLSASHKGLGRESPSAEVRMRISQTLKGHPVSVSTRAKLSAKHKGKIISESTRAKIGAAMKGNQYGRGYKHTAAAKAKISEAGKGNQNTKGMKQSPESIAKTRAANIGRKRSPETIAKMSASQTGKRHSDAAKIKISLASKGNQYWLGKKHSEESKAKMRGAHKGTVHTEESNRKRSASLKVSHARRREQREQHQRFDSQS